MAILQRAFFLLLCALLLIARLSQADIYHEIDESNSSSSTSQQEQSSRKEIKIIEDKTQVVIGGVCGVMRPIGLPCAVGRKFMTSTVLDIAHKFVNVNLRMIYAVVHICGKLSSCIGTAVNNLVSALIAQLPPCTQKLLSAIKHILGTILSLISEVTRIVFNFTKDVAKCTIGIGKCIGSIFGSVFQRVMECVKSIIQKITEIVKRVLGEKEECPPPPEPAKDPEVIIVVCGTCVLCAFKPDAGTCTRLN